jgi:hypothetical protein
LGQKIKRLINCSRVIRKSAALTDQTLKNQTQERYVQALIWNKNTKPLLK